MTSAVDTTRPGTAHRRTSLPRLAAWELLKIRTTRMWMALLLIGALLVVVQAGFLAALAGSAAQPGQPPMPSLDDPGMLRMIYSSGFLGGYVVTLILGVLGFTAEYRHQTITDTLLAVPRRSRVVLAKVTAYVIAGILGGILLVGIGVVAAGTVILVRGHPLGLLAEGVPRTLGLSVLGCAVWTVFGLGLGTLVRNQIAAIGIGIGGTVVEALLAMGLNQFDGGGAIAQFLPGQASSAIAAGPTTGAFEAEMLPWWGGMLTLVAYGLVLGAAGAALTLRRDVT